MPLKSPLAIAAQLRRSYKSRQRRRRTNKRLGLDIKDRFYYPAHTVASPSGRRYSVVSAVYGVERYIDDMMASLLRQTLDFRRHIQVILVDDGSIDRSGAICDEWAACFPDNVRVIHKENGGQATARNAGLPLVTGDWVTFTDPDDILDKNYFLNVDRALDDADADNRTSIVACPYLFYYEAQARLSNTHPLRDRFRYGVRRLEMRDDTPEFHMHAASSLFRTDLLRDLAIRFPDIRPNGEDAHFIAQLCLAAPRLCMLYVPSAKYWYRKRAEETSTLDSVWNDQRRYSSLLQDFYLNIFDRSIATKGLLPQWLQRMVLYDIVWHIRHFTNRYQNIRKIPNVLRDRYIQLLRQILRQIEPDLIQNFELAGLSDDHRFTLLHLGHPDLSRYSRIKVFDWDRGSHQLGVRYHYVGEPPQLDMHIDGTLAHPAHRTTRVHRFLGQITAYSVDAWYPWPGCGMLRCTINGTAVEQPMRQRAKTPVINRFAHARPPARLPRTVRVYRRLASHGSYARRFKNAWLLMDRDTQADDNAEHLYRYIRRNHPQVNAWFVLRRTSFDWDRLRKEGFRLVAFGSLAHKMLLINAAHHISSSADHYVENYLPRRYYVDLSPAQDYTFLQHGVIKDDLSDWLNTKRIRHFITSAPREYDSIVRDGPYKFTDREIALTGLPRHDYLYQHRHDAPQKCILIMPTWRNELSGKAIGKSSRREYNPDLLQSRFFKAWMAVLNSPRLEQLAKQYGYRLLFFPHANLTAYIKDFRKAHVQVIGHADVRSIQDLFLTSSVMITDYSSVAFEMAYLQRPVAYYQFDEDEVFNGGHTTQRGYFDYRRDGFGPVCTEQDVLLDALEGILAADCTPAEPYASRMRDFFAFRDGKCCERVFHLISNGQFDSGQPAGAPAASRAAAPASAIPPP